MPENVLGDLLKVSTCVLFCCRESAREEKGTKLALLPLESKKRCLGEKSELGPGPR